MTVKNNPMRLTLHYILWIPRKFIKLAGLFNSVFLFINYYLFASHFRTQYKKAARQDKKMIVMAVISQLSRDPRVEREARALASQGYRIKIYFPAKPGAEIPNWGSNIECIALPESAASFGRFFPFLCGEEFLRALLQDDPYAFHCHDLNTCIIGLVASKIMGCYFIGDFHEWFSENVSWNPKKLSYEPHRLPRRLAYRFAERLVSKNADLTITVCESIGKMIEENNHLKSPLSIIRNIPILKTSGKPTPDLRKDLNLSPQTTILLYQGGVGPTRLLEPIIEAMQYTEDCHFIIRGPGNETYGPIYKALAAKCNSADKISILPPVESSLVVDAAKSADIGIWTLPNLSPNFYYALPNKVFEYLAANLPVLVAHYPEPTKIVETYNVGLTFDPYSPKSIAEAINKLVNNKELLSKMKMNTADALKDLDAENEWNKLTDLYKKLESKEPNFLRI
ncbi:MAG: glycosyltransferase [Pseudobdellovibrio sp.]